MNSAGNRNSRQSLLMPTERTPDEVNRYLAEAMGGLYRGSSEWESWDEPPKFRMMLEVPGEKSIPWNPYHDERQGLRVCVPMVLERLNRVPRRKVGYCLHWHPNLCTYSFDFDENEYAQHDDLAAVVALACMAALTELEALNDAD